MKKLLFGCALAVSGFIMPAANADFGGPFGCDPCCDEGFNGFYFGGNLGIISNTFHRNDFDGFLTDNSGWTVSQTDFTAGLQLGYDWQFCNKLAGLVVDWNWEDVEKTFHDNPNADSGNHVRNNAHWFSTIRGRFGLTICDALVYVTVGSVVSRFHTRWTDEPDSFRDRHCRWGWTTGIGTEFILGCNWSLGVEALYLQFCDHNRTFTTAVGTSFDFGHSDSAWVARFLLNYRFGDLCGCW